MWRMIVLGLPVGLLFGYVLQRGGVCLNDAVRRAVLHRDGRLAGAWLVAVAVHTALAWAGRAPLDLPAGAPPVWWLAALAGGACFGVGMSLAQGCAAGSFHRAGEGDLGAWAALAGLALAMMAARTGLLHPLVARGRGPVLDVPPTVDDWLAVSPGWAVLGLALLALLAVLRGGEAEPAPGRWPGLATGLVLGVLGAVAWVASALAGRPAGLALAAPLLAWDRVWLLGDVTALDWGAVMVAGVPLGAAWSAHRQGTLRWRLPPPNALLRRGLGGGLMGLGAAAAGGGSIGHGLTGVSLLSVTAGLTLAGMMAGGVVAALAAHVRQGRRA